MFDFSWSEILLIGIVALVFIGPKELPGVLRTLGQWMSKIRRMAGDFQNQFHDAMREAELADLKKEVDAMASQAAGYANIDPLADVRKDMENAQREVETALAGTPAGDPLHLEDGLTPPSSPGEAPAASEPAPTAVAASEEAKDAVKAESDRGTGGSAPA
jgi:sec-independent protein translocase protein TatB